MTHEHKWQRIINGDGLCECGAKLIEPFEKEPATPKNSEWEIERWEEWVRTLADSTNPKDIDLLIAKIKVLLQERSKDTVGELRKEVEAMKVKEVPVSEIERLKNANHFEQKIEMYKMGYNSALNDVLQKLSEQLNQK